MASTMQCYPLLTMEKTELTTRSSIYKHLKINFTFSLKNRYRNYRMTPHSRTGPELIRGPPEDGDYEDFAFGSALFLKPFPDAGVREAVERAVEGAGLDRYDRAKLVDRALKEVRKYCPKGEIRHYTIVDLDFEVLIEHEHVYILEEAYDYPRMIPAAASAMGMLEKCEVGGARAEEAERCCCICLEELGGEAAARMPCKHVFHGGCIKEWLRTSHYCPLCRYEMPTAC